MKENKNNSVSPKKQDKPKKTSEQRKEEFKDFFMRNNKRNLKITIGVVVGVLVILIAGISFFVANKLGKLNFSDGKHGDEAATFAPEENFKAMYDVQNASDIDSLLEAWATNGGEKFRSKNVINVLLLGIDGTEGDVNGGRSDVMMLVSLNKKTKTISLVSFLRDSYTYMNINGQGRCCKLNHSHKWGGPATLIETLENDYKIEIDNYVSVNFTSFPKLIDALGGVEVPITQKEADYINRTTTKIKKVKAGEKVKLDGKQALVFSRIRKLDSDIGRVDRQKSVITGLINSAKTASTGQLNNALNIVLPNVTTNYKKSEIVSLLSQALSQGWMNYEIKEVNMPSEGNYIGANLWTYNAKITGFRASTWVIDYPVCARELQLALYGDTNINISENHVSAIDLLTKGATPNPDYNTPTKNQNETEETPDDIFDDGDGVVKETLTEIATNDIKETDGHSSIIPSLPSIGDLIPTRPHKPDSGEEQTQAPQTEASLDNAA